MKALLLSILLVSILNPDPILFLGVRASITFFGSRMYDNQ
jgi:hypothetical protein